MAILKSTCVCFLMKQSHELVVMLSRGKVWVLLAKSHDEQARDTMLGSYHLLLLPWASAALLLLTIIEAFQPSFKLEFKRERSPVLPSLVLPADVSLLGRSFFKTPPKPFILCTQARWITGLFQNQLPWAHLYHLGFLWQMQPNQILGLWAWP